MNIRKGDIWTCDGQTVNWLTDMMIGDVLCVSSVLINGTRPEAGDVIPAWAMKMFSRGNHTSTDDVTVTRSG